MRRPPIGRLVALFAALALAFGAITVRLAVLQVSRAGAYQTLALDQRLRTVSLPAWRGQIVDRSGEPLAISLPARDVYADPRYVVDPWGTAVEVSSVLGATVRELELGVADLQHGPGALLVCFKRRCRLPEFEIIRA